MTFLTRDTLLQHRPPRHEDVPVPELATEQDPNPMVRIRSLSATEVDRFLGSLWTDGKYSREDYASKLLVLGIIDETGKSVFTIADVPALGQQDSALVQRLAMVVERLSGLQVKPQESAGN